MSEWMESNPPNEYDIAVIGMAARFPGARDVDEFWQNLCRGVESVSFFSQQELLEAGVPAAVLSRPNYVPAGAVLEDIEWFDASFFGYKPREAALMDPQQRIFLECAWQALERAGYDSESYSGSVGVYAGVGLNTYALSNLYAQLFANPTSGGTIEQWTAMLGNDKDHLALRTSYKLNLNGPSLVVQSACSTSLVAAHLACQGLLAGECDMALAGGVTARVPHRIGYLYQEGGIFSPDGHCRSFDADAQGTINGNGVGIVVLKRLRQALEDGDYIHAVIKGSAINNDGASKIGYTAPSIEGQVRVIRAAQTIAGVLPETIRYVEAHGTATPLGDPVEVAALTQVFREHTDAKGFCAIGSVKSNIGHTDAAAGVAGLIKTALTVQHKTIPPSLHFRKPNPQIDLANSPFYINTQLSPSAAGRTPFRAAVNSLGIGGTNAHMIVEEAPARKPSGPSRPWQLLLLSAKTSTALKTASDHLGEHMQTHPDENLADVAYTLQVGRRAFSHRQMLVCRDPEETAAALVAREPQRVWTSVQEEGERPVAFLLPGLGDHYVHMGWGLYRTEPTFREQVDRCAELLRPHLGRDVRDVLYPDWQHRERAAVEPHVPLPRTEPDLDLQRLVAREPPPADEATRQLNQTFLVQPILFVVEYALARLWMDWGVRPRALIGHSLGEYTAACLAGVFSLEDGLFLVAERARLIQELPEGGMLSVLLPESEVRPLLGEQLSLAAVNGTTVCVAAGPLEALGELEQHLMQEGVACRRLPTAHAFHSRMMEPLVERLTQAAKSIQLNPPRIPYLSNVTGTWITEQAADPTYWGKHLCQTVRFGDGIQKLLQEPNHILLEVGPGRTLGNLARENATNPARHAILPSLPNLQQPYSDVELMVTSFGRLWLAGASVNGYGFYAGQRRHRLPLPTYPFERQRCWIERAGPSGASQRQAATPLDAASEHAPDGTGVEQQIPTQAIVPDAGPLPSTPFPQPGPGAASPFGQAALAQTIARVWQEYLGAEYVGLDDNFFDLGGDSVTGLMIVNRLQEELQVTIPIVSLYQGATIRGLVKVVAQDQPADTLESRNRGERRRERRQRRHLQA